jgi:1-phosphofructokinase family hexose kinase
MTVAETIRPQGRKHAFRRDAVILAAGLTPAWQHVLVFSSFTPGTVNRAGAVYRCASGKALNAGRAMHHLGAPCRTLVPAGGLAGEAMRRDFAGLSIAARWVETAAPTRECTTLLVSADRTATELVENAHGLTAAELDAFGAAYAEEASAAAFVVLTGSLPEGTPAAFYRALLARTPCQVLLDARGPEMLAALQGRPLLVKPNREELAQTLGRDLRRDADLWQAMAEVRRRGAAWVLITDGKNPVFALGDQGLYRIDPPPRPVVNPIGCGDCMAGAIAWALHQGRELVQALRYGAAAAAAKVGELLPGRIDPDHVEALAATIDVARMG